MMTTRIPLTRDLILGLFLAVGCALVPAGATAQDVCAAPDPGFDEDADGFGDPEECSALNLADQSSVLSCDDPLADPESCLDPGFDDLFFLILDDPAGQMPLAPVGFVDQATGGLDIVLHRLDPSFDNTNRFVALDSETTSQRYVRITENLDPVGNLLGVAQYGTPNGIDRSTVYTERIKNFVTEKCEGKQCCVSDSAVLDPPCRMGDVRDIVEVYIRHTTSHEVGHLLSLTQTYNSRFGGNHYKSGTNLVMDQSVKYTDKQGKVTFFISGDFGSADLVDRKLK